MRSTVNQVLVISGLTVYTDSKCTGFHRLSNSTSLLRDEGSFETSRVEGILLHLIRDVGSRSLVLRDREDEVTRIQKVITDSLTFFVVVDLCLTERRNVESIAVREVLNHIDIAHSEEIGLECLLEARGPDVRPDQMVDSGSHYTRHFISLLSIY